MQDQLQAERFNFFFLLVNFLVGSDYLFRQTKVVAQQRLNCAGDGGFTECTHRNEAVVKQVELLVKSVAHASKYLLD